MLPTSDPDIDISSQRVDIQTSNGQTGKSFPPSESLEDAVTTLAEYLRTLPR